MLAEFLWIDGRATRGRWWLTGFLQIAIMVGLLAVMWPDMISTGRFGDDHSLFYALSLPVGWIGIVSNVRRYHDRDKNGWWMLIGIIPIIGTIWQAIELGMLPGTSGDNRYGPPPGGGADISNDMTEMRTQRPTGSLAKVDDDYLAAYAKRYKAEQAAASAVHAAPAFTRAAPTGASFGKRR